MDAEEQATLINRVLSCNNHYERLGVTRSASPSTIRTAYRNLSRKLHPDKNSSTNANEAFLELKASYDILQDSEKRNNYNLKLDIINNFGVHFRTKSRQSPNANQQAKNHRRQHSKQSKNHNNQSRRPEQQPNANHENQQNQSENQQQEQPHANHQNDCEDDGQNDNEEPESEPKAYSSYFQHNKKGDQKNDFFWLVTIAIICGVFYFILMCSPFVMNYYDSGWQSATKTSHARNDETKTKTDGQPKPSSKSYKNHHPYTFTPQKDSGHIFEHHSEIFKGVFYTKEDFEKQYKSGTLKRNVLNVEIDEAYADVLEALCFVEEQEIEDLLKSLEGTEHGHGTPRYRKNEAKLRSKTKKCEIIAKIVDYLQSPIRRSKDITRDPEILAFLKSNKIPDGIVPKHPRKN